MGNGTCGGAMQLVAILRNLASEKKFITNQSHMTQSVKFYFVPPRAETSHHMAT